MERIQLKFRSGYLLKHLRDACTELLNVICRKVQENPS